MDFVADFVIFRIIFLYFFLEKSSLLIFLMAETMPSVIFSSIALALSDTEKPAMFVIPFKPDAAPKVIFSLKRVMLSAE